MYGVRVPWAFESPTFRNMERPSPGRGYLAFTQEERVRPPHALPRGYRGNGQTHRPLKAEPAGSSPASRTQGIAIAECLHPRASGWEPRAPLGSASLAAGPPGEGARLLSGRRAGFESLAASPRQMAERSRHPPAKRFTPVRVRLWRPGPMRRSGLLHSRQPTANRNNTSISGYTDLLVAVVQRPGPDVANVGIGVQFPVATPCG